MKSDAEQIGAPAPTIAVLPTPTPEDRIAELVQQNAAHVEGLAQQSGVIETLANNLKQSTNDLDTAKATIQWRDEEHVKALAEKDRDIELVRAELENHDQLLKAAQTERDEAVAQWEEWGTHPFFSAILQLTRQSSGTPVSEELAEKMKELVNAVADTGKAGTVSLVLAAKPLEGQTALVIGAKVTSKLPKGDPDTAIVFMTDKGTMTSEDPKQKRLPLSGDKKMKPKVNPIVELAKAKTAKVTEISAVDPAELSEGEEEIYERAAEIASGEKVTTPILQRRLKIGYSTAAKIFTSLKERGALAH